MPRQLSNNLIPFGENGLTPDFLYTQREYYLKSTEIYPIGPNIPRPIDIWYQRPLWGKVDTFQRPIIPKNKYLKPISEDLMAMNFVANAYFDFRHAVLEARRKLKSSAATVIDINNPKKAFEDTTDFYNYYFKNKLDLQFKNSYLSEKSRNSTTNFKTYINKYLNFAETKNFIPHTLSGYLICPTMSNRTSGLIIEFALDEYGTDDQKWIKYLSSDFFIDYIKLAANFGFYINKHIPWSIVANIGSVNMKRYMAQVNVFDPADTFFKNYLQAEYISYVSFKKYMFVSYYSIISSRPRMEKIVLNNCIGDSPLESRYQTSRILLDRKTEFKDISKATYDEFLSYYSENFFLEKYFRLKLIEEKITLTPKRFNVILYKLQETASNKDIYDAIIQLANFLAKERNKKYIKYRNKF